MKYGILLIGFEYKGTDKWNTLPGIPVDLYQAYRYFNHITKNILVFTDITQDYRTSILKRAILDGYVDSNLLSFIEDTKDKNQYTQYISTQKGGYNNNNFDPTIIDFIKGVDRLVFYYTGHGKEGNIILPDDTYVSLDYIRDLLINHTGKKCQILSLLDCCQSSGMKLPYVISNGLYKLNCVNTITEKEIICISSSGIRNDSSATHTGSVFTRKLFGYLSNTIIPLSRLNKYGFIYSTYPTIKILWGWVTTTYKNDIDLIIDNNNSVITVVLHNSQPTVEKSKSLQDYIRYHSNLRY
jgi:hypothetical protein